MDAAECRKRALHCQVEANRTWGALQGKFLETAAAWIDLADQMDRREKAIAAAEAIGSRLASSR